MCPPAAREGCVLKTYLTAHASKAVCCAFVELHNAGTTAGSEAAWCGGLQLVKVGVTAVLLVAATRMSRTGPLMPLRVYLWAAGGAFVTWRIASTAIRRLVHPVPQATVSSVTSFAIDSGNNARSSFNLARRMASADFGATLALVCAVFPHAPQPQPQATAVSGLASTEGNA